MRNRLISLLIMALSWMGTGSRLTCQGSTFDLKSVFCYDQKRDVDMLVDSFLELGLDANAMLVSALVAGSRQVTTTTTTRAVTTAPVTTTAVTTIKVTSTTTTLPPNRRRVQAGWPESGAAPCEDNNPSDAADTDCYAIRYGTFKDKIYEDMKTMSVSVHTTKTYSEKLGAYIYSVNVPLFQSSLATALQQGVPILTTVTNDALGDLSTSVKQAPLDTATYAASLDIASNTTLLSLKTKIQTAFDELTGKSLSNINALVKRANDRNAVLMASPYSSTLKFTTGNGSTVITNDENTMLGLVNKLTLLQQTVGTSLFYSQSNLTAINIPQLLGNGSSWVTAKQSYLNQTLGKLVSSITLSNISGVVNQTDAGINSTLLIAKSDLNTTLSTKANNTLGSLGQLQSLISSAGSGVNSTYASLLSGVAQAQTSVQSGTFAAYTPMQNSLQQLLNFLSAFGSDYVASWETGATDRLTRLKGYVSLYAAALTANSTQTVGNGTSGIQNSVLQSLAQIGSIQNQINSQMLNRQSSALSQMQQLMSKAQGNAVSFSQLLSNVSVAIASLKQSGSTSSPLSLVSNITARMDQLAFQISNLVQDTNAGFANVSAIVSSELDSYNAYTRDWWSGQVDSGAISSLKGQVKTNISVEDSRLSNASDSISAKDNALDIATYGALGNVQNAKNQLFDNTRRTYSVISSALTQVSQQAGLGVQSISNALVGIQSSLNSLWLQSPPLGLDGVAQGTRSDMDNVVDALASSVKQAVDGFTQSTQVQVLQPATSLAGLVSKLNTAISFNAPALAGEKSLNNSIALLDTTMNDLLVTDLAANVKTGLFQASTASNQLPSDYMKISTGVSQDLATTQSLHSSLDSIVSNLQSLMLVSNTSNANSGNALLAVLNAGININSLLSAEIGYLSGGVAGAASAINSDMANLTSSIGSDSITNSWYRESNDSVSTNWTIGRVAPAMASLNLDFSAGISQQRLSADAAIKSKLGQVSQSVSGLTTRLGTAAGRASSLSDLLMTSMNQTINTIQGKVGGNQYNPLPQLQGVLNTVSQTVRYATGSSADRMANASTGTVDRILGSQSLASSNFASLSSTANSAVATATASIAAGLRSINTVDEIVATSEADRSQSAELVLSQIDSNQNKMQEMFNNAVASSSVGNASPLTTADSLSNIPALLQAAGGQLKSWNAFTTDVTSRMSDFDRVLSDGVDGEQSILGSALMHAGNQVSDSVNGVRSSLSGMGESQFDLDDRIYKLGELEDTIDSRLVVTRGADDVSGISNLALAPDIVTGRVVSEQARLAVTERDIDAMLARANAVV